MRVACLLRPLEETKALLGHPHSIQGTKDHVTRPIMTPYVPQAWQRWRGRGVPGWGWRLVLGKSLGWGRKAGMDGKGINVNVWSVERFAVSKDAWNLEEIK